MRGLSEEEQIWMQIMYRLPEGERLTYYALQEYHHSGVCRHRSKIFQEKRDFCVEMFAEYDLIPQSNIIGKTFREHHRFNEETLEFSASHVSPTDSTTDGYYCRPGGGQEDEVWDEAKFHIVTTELSQEFLRLSLST